MMINPLILAVRMNLTPELKNGAYDGLPFPSGYCYCATEALYHLLGKVKCMYVPHVVKVEGDTHWYLEHRFTGSILDPTADQYGTVEYDKGVGKGFLTSHPSRRAQIIIDRVRLGVLNWDSSKTKVGAA